MSENRRIVRIFCATRLREARKVEFLRREPCPVTNDLLNDIETNFGKQRFQIECLPLAFSGGKGYLNC